MSTKNESFSIVNESRIDFSKIGTNTILTNESIGIPFLLKQAILSTNKCIYKDYRDGYLDDPSEILNLIKSKCRLLYHSSFVDDEQNIYFSDDTFVQIETTPAKKITINSLSTDEKFFIELRQICKSKLTSAQKQGYVFAITRGSSGSMQLTRVGYAGVKLEKLNYTPNIVNDYDFIVNDLKTQTPYGRIVLLDGPPGCGKSFFVRGLLNEISKAMFVVVPPAMVSSLGGPDLLPLLLKTKENNSKKGPIILILEDADNCLAPRASDNISAISSILNMGDGIFGSLFDIRIIATTNTEVKQIDQAILRDGRLSKRITLLPMNYEDADVVFKRLVGDNKILPKHENTELNRLKPSNIRNKYSLAEIYKLARENGWKPNLSKEELVENNENNDYDDLEEYV